MVMGYFSLRRKYVEEREEFHIIMHTYIPVGMRLILKERGKDMCMKDGNL